MGNPIFFFLCSLGNLIPFGHAPNLPGPNYEPDYQPDYQPDEPDYEDYEYDYKMLHK